MGSALLAFSVPASLASLIMRWRRSRHAERQQLKWFILALAVVAVLNLHNWGSHGLLGDTFIVVGWSLPAAAIGVAILRYRLYDIDRIISRTVSYTLLTSLLGTVYVVGVALLRPVVGRFAGQSDLAVAASTLAVAALFGPARRRLQVAVDRRFNRTRYDAGKAVASFATRLRDEVDLDELSAALLAAVHATVQPSRVSLWLREVRS